MDATDCCILNAGGGSWAFAPLAELLSCALWIDVAAVPRHFNYLLLADDAVADARQSFFIPVASMELAADKRALARVFAARSVPTPETHLVESLEDARRLAATDGGKSWCLKFPTGCGATGHRLLTNETAVLDTWPRPLVVQEFIRMERPEVFRLYAAGGHLFGWVARRFPPGVKPSPWVAHARGAQYELAGNPPAGAMAAARAALDVTGLLATFGCVDLLRRTTGEWVVLEVGTDGMFNHVDRDLGLPELELDIQQRIAEAFWQKVSDRRPWGDRWHPRPSAVA
ncbi:MAG: hypothetical protein JWO31_465 [Phycisphaerales bacterium]|nr:hypothetical protein [Phycisphaerales bacterium]